MSPEQRIASLELTLQCYKSQMSDLVLRARQSEEMVHHLMSDIDMGALTIAIGKHMDQRSSDRAIHQQALIQATLTALMSVKGSSQDQIESMLNLVVKQLMESLQVIGFVNQLNSKIVQQT